MKDKKYFQGKDHVTFLDVSHVTEYIVIHVLVLWSFPSWKRSVPSSHRSSYQQSHSTKYYTSTIKGLLIITT